MGRLLSPQYGHVILVSRYPVLTAIKINQNMDGQYQVAGFHKTRKIEHWFTCVADGRTYGHETTKIFSDGKITKFSYPWVTAEDTTHLITEEGNRLTSLCTTEEPNPKQHEPANVPVDCSSLVIKCGWKEGRKEGRVRKQGWKKGRERKGGKEGERKRKGRSKDKEKHKKEERKEDKVRKRKEGGRKQTEGKEGRREGEKEGRKEGRGEGRKKGRREEGREEEGTNGGRKEGKEGRREGRKKGRREEGRKRKG